MGDIMVKNLLELNNKEKLLALSFITRNESESKSLEQIENSLKGKIYHYGKGVIFYFQNKSVVGKASVVLEIVEKLKTTYIHSIDILEDSNNKGEILNSLITKGKDISKEYGANKILLGIRNDEVLNIANSLGLYKDYYSYNMELKDREIKNPLLNLTSLTKENKFEYLKIFNDAFMDMPHGTYYTIEDIEEILENSNTNEEYFIASINETPIGFMSYTINDNEGYFDIGLCKEFRNKGYGTLLLETAIHTLSTRNVQALCLTVIEQNTKAFSMYKKRGFEIKNILSNWIVL